MRKYPILLILFIMAQFAMGWWFVRDRDGAAVEREYGRLARVQEAVIVQQKQNLEDHLHLLRETAHLDRYHELRTISEWADEMAHVLTAAVADLEQRRNFGQAGEVRALEAIQHLERLARRDWLPEDRSSEELEKWRKDRAAFITKATAAVRYDIGNINYDWPADLQSSTAILVLYRYLHEVRPRAAEVLGVTLRCFLGTAFHPLPVGPPKSYATGDSLAATFRVVEFVDSVHGSFAATVNGEAVKIDEGGHLTYRSARTAAPDTLLVRLQYVNPLTGEYHVEGGLKMPFGDPDLW